MRGLLSSLSYSTLRDFVWQKPRRKPDECKRNSFENGTMQFAESFNHQNLPLENKLSLELP
jgi:hypothetical protein